MPSLRALGAALSALTLLAGSFDQIITDIQYDSRQVNTGSLFVCIPGLKTDGHLFAQEAIAKGAVALVVERPIAVPPGVTVIKVPDARKALALLAGCFFDYPSRLFNLIGVTGTNGKTSTVILLEAIFSHWGKKTGLLGTIANRVGRDVLPTTHTTPESLELQRLFKNMVQANIDYVMMEVSSHALSLSRVEEAEFDIAIFTNLSRDHLDFHRDFADYRAAKTKLFQQLRAGGKKRPSYGLVNGDDPDSAYFRQASSVPIFTYGLKEASDFQAVDLEITSKGTSFRIQGISPLRFQLNMIGRFSVYNALGAIGVAIKEGVPIAVIEEALSLFPGVPGRFELVEAGQDFTIVVDYAHTPDGLENVLQTAKELSEGRVITVFGCGGDRDRLKRPQMGAVAGRYSDYVIITSDNPRTEDPQAIIAEIEQGLVDYPGRYEILVDRREGIKRALELADAKDFVLIAGKGHEDYQIIGTKKYPFDDREVVRGFIKGE